MWNTFQFADFYSISSETELISIFTDTSFYFYYFCTIPIYKNNHLNLDMGASTNRIKHCYT